MSEITKSPAAGSSKMAWFWPVFFALAAFVFLFGLTIPLVGPDEPRYAEVAREMFQRGDWITPTLGGFNWFEKPALLYWLEIVSYRMFGVTEFAARFGSALCGLGTVWCLWIMTRLTTRDSADPLARFANWTAMIAASTIGILAFSHGASFDIVVTFPVTASLTGFFVYDSDHDLVSRRQRVVGLASFYFFIGVALLAKGLIGLVFPFAIIAVYFLLQWRRPSRALVVSLIWGVPVLLAVAATWYLPMYLQHGWQFIDEFIIQQHFERFATNKYQHPQPFYFFFWVLPLMTIPWLPFFLIGIWTSVRNIAQGIRGSAERAKLPASHGGSDLTVSASSLLLFSLSWILVPLIFFSFSGSKLPGYILPALPATILLTSVYVYSFAQKSELRRWSMLTLAVGTLAVLIIAVIFVVPRFAQKESVKALIAAADRHGYTDSPVAAFLTVSHNAEFYAAGRVIRDEDGKPRRFVGAHEIRQYIDQHEGEPLVVLVPKDQVGQLTASALLETQILDDNGELDVAIVQWK